MQLMRNQNMKHIAVKDINSAYGTSNGNMLFDGNNTSQNNVKYHKCTHERRSINQ